jgi:hypothetical protein
MATLTSLSPSVGPTTGGTVVTITGTGFAGAAAVTFGGTAATTFVVNSATQITATSPSRPAGNALVVVSAPSGVSNPLNFVYQAVAAPVVTAVNPSVGPTSGGTVVTITGTGLAGATSVTFGGAPAATFTVNSATQITATTPVHAAGAAAVVVTKPGANSSNSDVAFFYANTPAITTLSPDQGTTAGGTVVTISGTGFTGATAVSFGGAPATGFTVNSDSQITATAPAQVAGTAQVVVTAPGGTSAGAAYLYIAAPVITTLVPTAGPAAGGNSVTITGSGLTFTSAVFFGATPAPFTVLSATQVVATAPPGTGTVQLTVISPGGTSNGLPYGYIPAPEI